jgi:SAM-dependent methyltransferase
MRVAQTLSAGLSISRRSMESGQNAYDEVFYAGEAYPQTHPNRLGSIATLFGMTPAPVATCRVLELGCGIGGNLIPMAEQWPEASFLGIDLSERSIDFGRRNIEALGLGNIELRHGDIMDVTAALGPFDYIIAHGVYSWVPDPVRRKVLSVCRDTLAPQGVAFMSFNAFPGCHKRNILRDIMLYHTRNIADGHECVRQARAIAGLVARNAGSGLYGEVLREQVERIETPDVPFYHDDLAPYGKAFLMHQVADAAVAEGMQYLGEATFARSTLGYLPPFIAAIVGRIPEAEFIVREQYLDLLVGRQFRESLFCRAEVSLHRSVAADAMKKFYVSLKPSPALHQAPQDVAPRDDASDEDRLVFATLDCLRAAAPRAVSFAEVVSGSAAGARAAGIDLADEAGAQQSVAQALLRLYRGSRIDLCIAPPALAAEVSERPCGSRVARHQAAVKGRVASLQHLNVNLSEPQRQCLLLADGTRTVQEIDAALDRSQSAEEAAPAERLLHELAHSALLAA